MFNAKNSTKPKSEPLQLLKYNKSVPTRIGIISLAGFSMAFFSLLLQLLNYGAVSSLGKKQLALVQLSSGESVIAQAVEPSERSNEVIKKFISDTFIKMFNWDGLVKTFNEKGEPITKQDTGIDVGRTEGSNGRVTTSAYEAAFAISEKQDFRTAFLRKLAVMTPAGIFNGDTQVSLIPRFISDPRKIKDGKWEIDLVATLVTFTRVDNAGQGISFNKTITVEAIDTPQEIPGGTTALAKSIYQSRRLGLEITQIVDLNIAKRK
ncbi:hypothetical protein QI031_31425 (plasmid) [Halotia branconii CENA392]|uniref:Esterase/lipase n=1 Tax=Halotia branconii CENA392 TaxID=1539056 RepID=A0AAJ6NYP8_9CYAN|nr:hypothetical protein [Halotia branconii]WGV29072.1 hypothetical protein QI031_31425 [Halotia branconii CENA392]